MTVQEPDNIPASSYMGLGPNGEVYEFGPDHRLRKVDGYTMSKSRTPGNGRYLDTLAASALSQQQERVREQYLALMSKSQTAFRRLGERSRCTVLPLDVDPTSNNQTPERHPMSDQKPDTDTTSELSTLEGMGQAVARTVETTKTELRDLNEGPARHYMLGRLHAHQRTLDLVNSEIAADAAEREAADMAPAPTSISGRLHIERDRKLREAQMILEKPTWGEVRNKAGEVVACGIVVAHRSETPEPDYWPEADMGMTYRALATRRYVTFYGQPEFEWTGLESIYMREATVHA